MLFKSAHQSSLSIISHLSLLCNVNSHTTLHWKKKSSVTRNIAPQLPLSGAGNPCYPTKIKWNDRGILNIAHFLYWYDSDMMCCCDLCVLEIVSVRFWFGSKWWFWCGSDLWVQLFRFCCVFWKCLEPNQNHIWIVSKSNEHRTKNISKSDQQYIKFIKTCKKWTKIQAVWTVSVDFCSRPSHRESKRKVVSFLNQIKTISRTTKTISKS